MYAVILRHISTLYDVGDMPYRVAAPLLQQCRPDQLRMIEDASPHLLEYSDELWHRACLRDFSELRKLHEDGTLPTPPSWRDLYRTKQQQTEEAKALATARVRGRYAEHSAQKDAKKLVVSNLPMPLHRRRRPMEERRPMSSLESKGKSMLLKARTGHAMRTRQMMRPVRVGNMHTVGSRTGFVRSAPTPQPMSMRGTSSSVSTSAPPSSSSSDCSARMNVRPSSDQAQRLNARFP